MRESTLLLWCWCGYFRDAAMKKLDIAVHDVTQRWCICELFHVNDADGNLALLPGGVDLGAATMVSDMVPTGFHGAELADIQFGDDVAVIGIGQVGLMSEAGWCAQSMQLRL